jgi:adenosylcobinamide kinase/adenosylcobinamide-phosphate guanylyltransferase
MKEIVFVIGGCRSGKSRFALEYADRHYGQKVFLATSEVFDDEMKKRVEKHRRDRGQEWTTIEEPLKVAEELASLGKAHEVVLIDCVTLWISNLLMSGEGEDEILTRADALVEQLKRIPQSTILVSNEVGMGIVPENRLARVFRDVAGAVNQRLASCADAVVFTVAGIPQVLKGELLPRGEEDENTHSN